MLLRQPFQLTFFEGHISFTNFKIVLHITLSLIGKKILSVNNGGIAECSQQKISI